MNKVYVYLGEYGILPRKKHPSDLGWDIYAPRDITYEHGYKETNSGIYLGPNVGCLLVDKSSFARKQIIKLGGVIDPNYRGEIIVCQFNLSNINHRIKAGEPIIQMIFMNEVDELIPIEREQWEEIKETDRADRGFGHG